MRKVTLLLAMIAFASFAFAQKGFAPLKQNLDYAQPGSELVNTPNHTKAPGDIIFQEDFNGEVWSGTSLNGEPVPANAPAGWEIGDLGGNGFYWRWDTIGPRGIFTGDPTCVDPETGLQSTTGANGFMMLEADWFNSAADCSDYFDIGMDSYFEYNAGIDFSAETAVHLVFEQSNRMCCGAGTATANAFFSYSTDNGATWTNISVSESNASNFPIGGIDAGTGAPYYSEFDVSNALAGEATVWFRFHMLGVSHYHWEIDDLAFIAPQNYDIQFLDYWNDYHEYNVEGPGFTEDFLGGFYEVPWFLSHYYEGFHAAFINFGGLDQTNMIHNVEIWRGNLEQTENYLQTSFATEPLADVPVGLQDTTMLEGTYMPTHQGLYTIRHYPTTDNVDEATSNDTLDRHFVIGDSLLSVVDFDNTNSSMSPDNYNSYEAGAGVGFTFTLPEPTLHDVDGNPDYYEVDGVYFYVSRNTQYPEEIALFENEEATAIISLYKYDEEADTYTLIIATEERTMTIEDTVSIVYMPFIKDFSSEYLFEGGDYLIALHMGGNFYDPFDRLQTWNIFTSTVQKNGVEQGVLVDPTVTNGESAGWIAEGPAMALKLQYTEEYPWPLGAAENFEKLDFKVYPNPTKGTFHIDAQGTSQVTVFNTAGQVVSSQIVNGNAAINLDVTTGVYFVRVQNGTKVGTERLIVE